MNFDFRVDDEVYFRKDSKRKNDVLMVLTKAFVADIFHAKCPDGTILRVRTSELVRHRRPSDQERWAQVQKRKADRALMAKVKADRAEHNRKEFEYVKEFKIRLTAAGLPDKRCKPKYTASNAPVAMKSGRRGSW